MKTISLENFNPKSKKDPIINSPRSLEACKRQGIQPNELAVLSLDEVKSLYGDKKLDKAGLEIVALHHEERRQEKVRVLLEERAQIMEEEANGVISFSQNQGSGSKSQSSHMQSRSTHKTSPGLRTDSTLIEKEKRQLERIKERQEKEIQQMIDYEKKMAEIRENQEAKLEKQRERAQQREREVSLRRQEAEEKKMQQELEKRRRAEEEEERRKAMMAEEFRRSQERLASEKMKERQRKLEAKQREEEQARKHEEFVRETEQKLREQQMLVDQKKQEMEEKDKIRQRIQREKQFIQKQEAEEKRRYHEEKLEHAKDRNEGILLQKRMEFEERQARNEYRRKQFEKELEYKKRENKNRAVKKAKTIQRVLEENTHIEERKRDEYYYKKMMAEERKRELDEIAEYERRQKIAEQKAKDMNRKQVKANMEHKLEERVGGYLEKMAESDEKVHRVQMEKEEAMKVKHALDVIKQHDKLENVQRIARMQEYQRNKIMEKIQSDTERANQIKQERSQLLEMRSEIKRNMDNSKRSLMSQFEMVKRGQGNPESMSVDYARSSSLMHNPQGSRLYSGSRTGATSSHSVKRAPTSANSHRRLYEQNHSASTHASDIKSGKQGQKEAKKIVENLKIKQNHEMLMLLEEEQNHENERELKLQDIHDAKMRERYEKEFAVERAKAHARIQQLADSHDDAIRQLMVRYNLK